MIEYRDLRGFIEGLRSKEQLREINGANWDLEIGAITEISEGNHGPALLFDNIKDYAKGYRVMTNIMTTPFRTAYALGLPTELSAIDLVKLWRTKKIQNVKPIEVSDGPVLENIITGDKIDILKFPVPRWHERDGGRMIGTGCAVINQDPDTGWVNYAPYRVQVHEKDLAGLYISPGRHGRIIYEKYHSRGKSCPVAVVCGVDPITFISAVWPVAPGASEYDFAGGIRGEPAKVIRGPATGLPIPYDAELVIEGEIPPGSVHSEGPFGEYLGYYASGERPAPIIKVQSVLHRDSPIMTGAPPMKPPLSSSIGLPLEFSSAIWEQMEAAGLPGIQAVWVVGVGNRMLVVVSIKQLYAGHAKQAGILASGVRAANPAGRLVIIVDEDIDVTNLAEVMWAVVTRCDPALGIDVLRDCWSTPLDPLISPDKRSRNDFTSSRAIINACKPFYWRDQFPQVNRISDELRLKTSEKWKDVLASN